MSAIIDVNGAELDIDTDNSFIVNPGSQTLFLNCPARECLLHGTRGGGKTAILLMDYLQDVGKGYGQAWTGILFRQTFPQLKNVIRESQKWFSVICPEARYNKSEHVWTWPTGETLQFAYMAKEEDYWNYHGFEISWLGWEELTTFPTLACYEIMKSCNRCSDPRVPKRIRATTNPFGPGHNAVKDYFINKAESGKIYKPKVGLERVHIYSSVFENKHIVENNPEYIEHLKSIPDKARRDAWLLGKWDIMSGGMFDDVFSDQYNIVESFRIPHTWRVYRSYDHGSSHPFSVGWHAVSDGSDYVDSRGNRVPTCNGDIFRFKEWYGCTGKPNEGLKMLSGQIATKVKCFDREIERKYGVHVQGGAADNAIFTKTEGQSVAGIMQEKGVKWEPCTKGPGSRKQRCDIMREMLYNARLRKLEPDDGFEMQKGYFVFRECQDFIRTVPTLPRSKKDPDDVDTDAEDHIFDEASYFLMSQRKAFEHQKLRGW